MVIACPVLYVANLRKKGKNRVNGCFCSGQSVQEFTGALPADDIAR